MASQAPATQMPLFYKELQPLSSNDHLAYKTRGAESAPYLGQTHAIPITIDEFIMVQRNYPIVFSIGDNPVPLALMGLNEGVNVFLDAEGKLLNTDVYVPAYVRRYPFMLARLTPDNDELSLCFDPQSGLVGDFEEGNALFTDDGKTSETTNQILKFCEDFEVSAQRTGAFMRELIDADLLMDGEVTIQPAGMDKPFVYRGFQMISEEKLRELRGDTLRKFNQNGILPLIMAHMFSLSQISTIFTKQAMQGKVPEITLAGEAAGNA
jgi:hypothetical protein